MLKLSKMSEHATLISVSFGEYLILIVHSCPLFNLLEIYTILRAVCTDSVFCPTQEQELGQAHLYLRSYELV